MKKHLSQGSFTTLSETRDTVHVKEVTKILSSVSAASYKSAIVMNSAEL